jgi:hypothetical protein
MNSKDGATGGPDSDPYAAIRPLVRLLARQAAREDFERALEAARMKPYSTEEVRGAPKHIEES